MAGDTTVHLSSECNGMEGFKSELLVRQFHPFHMDEPKEIGGTDAAPNPMEYVLSALAGCESVMLKMIAGELGMAITDLHISTQGEIDLRGLKGVPKINPHFQSISQTIKLSIAKGSERVDELMEEMKKRCPGYNLIKDAKIPLKVEHQVIQ